MILAVCFRRSAFGAHFSPREIVCLPTAMTFAWKIRRYRFRCIVLACKPAWRYGFAYGSGGYPILVSRAASGRRCRDSHQERRAERLCLILVGDDAAEQLCLILVGGRRGGATLPDSRQGRRGEATLPDSRREGCVKQRVPLSRPSASARAAFPSLFDCGSCRAMTHVISSIGLQKLT